MCVIPNALTKLSRDANLICKSFTQDNRQQKCWLKVSFLVYIPSRSKQLLFTISTEKKISKHCMIARRYGDSWTASNIATITSLRKHSLKCISNEYVVGCDVTWNWIYCHGFVQDFKPWTEVSRLYRLKCSWMPAMVCWNITRKDWREQRLQKGRSQKKNSAKLIYSFDDLNQGQLIRVYAIYVVGQ